MHKPLTALLLLAILASGCASSAPPVRPPADSGLALQVALQVAEANRRLERGETEPALALYEQLLDSYQSPSGALESAILTNAALASLQMGERERFLHYADELRRQSAALRHYPRNTQLVLVLAAAFRGESLAPDVRISVGLKEAVALVLGAQ